MLNLALVSLAVIATIKMIITSYFTESLLNNYKPDAFPFSSVNEKTWIIIFVGASCIIQNLIHKLIIKVVFCEYGRNRRTHLVQATSTQLNKCVNKFVR